jgi:hypothetical protein
MSVQYADFLAGTAKTWKSTGGDYAITLTSLSNGSGREGVKGDFLDGTKGSPAFLEIRFESSVGSAATNGNQIELYFGESDSATAGTNNPGNLTGADAGLSNPDELKLQLNLVGGINLSNARGTAIQKQRFVYYPAQRYLVPLVVNKSGQTLGGTAGDHQIVVTPFFSRSGY